MKVLHVRTKLPQNSWLPFQRGIIISANSLINLFHDIKERYPIVDYIVTARLNQDPLENLFSCVRGLGGSFTQPGPVEFMNRFRLLLLSKECEVVVNRPAVAMNENHCSIPTSDMTSTVLNQKE